MKETPLQTQKNQLIMQQQQLIQALKEEAKIKQEENLNQQQIIEAQKAYISELESSHKLHHSESEISRKEIFLLNKELKDKESRLKAQENTLKRYQEEIQKEVSLKPITDSLEGLEMRFKAVLDESLSTSKLHPLIQPAVQKCLQPYMSVFELLASTDWSRLQDDE